jgi:hypothetical protein
MEATAYRWCCPDGGTAASPSDLAKWVVANLAGSARIYAHPRDLPALQATIVAGRVALLPPQEGIVQPGTVWVGGA